MMTLVSFRLPKGLVMRLERFAASVDRPKSYLIRQAIKAYFAEHTDCEIATGRLRDKDDAIISGNALRKMLSL